MIGPSLCAHYRSTLRDLPEFKFRDVDVAHRGPQSSQQRNLCYALVIQRENNVAFVYP